MANLRLIPLDDVVVFPGMPVTVSVDVGSDDRVLLVPRQQDTCARVGAVPVFVDVDPQTINLDPARVAAAIGERTRAIIVVHFAGCPADLDRLTEVCQQHNLVLIEYCAQAHGARYEGKAVGTWGAIGCR